MFEIKNNKAEKEKKFISVMLYGAKPNVVKPPNIKGAKNKTNNLLSNKLFNCVPLLVK